MLIRKLLLALLFYVLCSKSFALVDSSNLAPMAVGAPVSPSCNYYFLDTYDGAVAVGFVTPNPTGSSLNLAFYNNTVAFTDSSGSQPLAATPPVSCDGNYKVIFSIQLKATTQVNSITVTTTLQNSHGQILYTAPAFIYPKCIVGYSYTCTISEISGSAIVHLSQGDSIVAPSLTATDIVSVVGGTFEVYFIPPS